MMNNIIFTGAELLVSYWIHSSIFIGAALIALRFKRLRCDRQGEWLLKSAMILGIVTSIIIVFLSLPMKNLTEFLEVKVQVTNKADIASHNSPNQRTDLQSNLKPAAPDKLSPIDKKLVVEQENKSLVKPESGRSGRSIAAAKNAADNNAEVIQSVAEKKQRASERENSESFLSSLLRIENLSVALVIFWSLGVAILATIKLIQAHQLKRLLSYRRRVESDQLKALFANLLNTSGIKRAIRLSECESIHSPLVYSSHEVIVPCDMADHLNVQQCEAALSHELAHLRRLDTVWLKFGLVVETLFFIQPLNKIINREIHQMAEQRSDRLAAEWTGNARALAEALSVTAHNNFQSSQTNMVFAMKSKKSNLLKRVENLLQDSAKKTSSLSMICGAILAVMVVLLAPGLSIQSVNASNQFTEVESNQARTTQASSTQVNTPQLRLAKSDSHTHIEDGSRQRFRTSSQIDDLKVKISADLKGKLQFSDDEKRLVNFPAKSELELYFDDGDSERKLKIVRGTGDIKYRYYEDGDKKTFDENAKAWFASVIPTFLRMTGLNAKERVARIKNKHGDEGVLNEIKLIHSDHVSSLYFHYLLDDSQLSDANILRAITLSQEIGSDFEHAKVLKHLVATQDFSDTELWLEILTATTSIGSDFEQAGVLNAFIPKLPQSQTIQKKFFESASNIGSDFEMKKVFSAFMKTQQFGDDGLIAMFSAAEQIGSDFELSSLLVEAAERVESSPEVFDAYIELSESIGSDFEMQRAFSELLKTDIDKKYLIQMIESASGQIGSDHELAKLLVKIIMRGELDGDIEAAIRSAVKSVGSSHERGIVLDRLNQQKG